MTNNKSKIRNLLEPKTFVALKTLQKNSFMLLILVFSVFNMNAQCTFTVPAYADNVVGNTGTVDVNVLLPNDITNCVGFSLIVTINGTVYLANTTATLGAGVQNVIYIFTEDADPTNIVTAATSFVNTDDQLPTAVCHQAVVTLTNASNGMAIVSAVNLGAGSVDNVTSQANLVYKIKRLGEPNTSYADYLQLDCDDQGLVFYEMQVTDEALNSNSCTDTLFVSDKLAPVLICPADQTIQCEDYIGNDYDTQFGAATASDVCGSVSLVELTPIVDISPCGEGTIFREWIATDPSGNADTCSQTIIIENQNNFVVGDINWPIDYTVNDCQPVFDVDSLDAPYDYPTFDNASCAMLAVNYSDSHFTSGYEGCSKIYRVWTVLNMCVYDPMNPTSGGSYSHVQILTALDTGDPIITGCIDTTMIIGNYTDDCGAQLAVLPTPSYDTLAECAPINLMEWHYSVMIYDDSVQEYVAYSQGEGVASEYFFNGLYKIDYTLSDPCGNTAGCWYMFEVKDLKKPNVYCQSGQAINIMQSGMISVNATDFDLGSTDNCSGVVFSFSSDITNTSVTFTCADIGIQNLQMWVTDEAGNQEFCNIAIDVQDNSNVCMIPQMLMVSGTINLDAGTPIEDVQVMLNTANYNMTDETGDFDIEVESNTEYLLTPHRNTNIRNGVNTYDLLKIGRHIMETEYLDSPYKIIAADVNGNGEISGADVVALRQIILYNMDEFPNGLESWRFVDGHYTFLDSTNPLDEDFNESISFNLNDNMDDANFVGLKVGDVTGDAQTVSDLAPVDPRASLDLLVKDFMFKAGENVEVVLNINEVALIGGQMEIKFDPSILGYKSVLSSDNSILNSNVGLRFVNEGTILLSWASDSEEDLVITLNFNAFENSQLSTVVGLNNSYLSNEIYTKSDKIGLNIVFDSHEMIDVDHFSMNNVPNPWQDATDVFINSDFEEDVVFLLMDINGRVVFEENHKIKEGNNVISLVNNGYEPGVYLLKIQGERILNTQKMIISK